MDESHLIKALDRDDSYRTIRVLGDGPSGRTELVRGLKAELLVRKRIPKELANERSWMTIRTMSHPLLPQVRDLYWLPDELVVILTYIDGITLGGWSTARDLCLCRRPSITLMTCASPSVRSMPAESSIVTCLQTTWWCRAGLRGS